VAYPQSAIDNFRGVVTSAQSLIANEDATQVQVEAMVLNLTAARDTFLAAAYGAIPASALMLGLSFDEGNAATTTLTSTGKGYIATLNPGIKIANEYPQFVTGKIGKAVHFGEGASSLSIDNFVPSDFLGPQLSIAVWVKPKTYQHNYFLSYNSWHGWKLQLQEQSKPFMTIATQIGSADPQISDADNEADNSCPEGEWTHLVVVTNLTAKTLSFYVNGVLTKTWTSSEKPALAGAGIVPPPAGCAITIGGAYKSLLDARAFDWADQPLEEYVSFFKGALDELKIYNIALEAGQVAKLYADELAK
jgi:hypothetical protein